ncbi:MAG TPA: hypothetical protein VFU47_14065, partial [Armatimonadota bacterium]|nr:hypothetical protein [Armatimonadota bacterium]
MRDHRSLLGIAALGLCLLLAPPSSARFVAVGMPVPVERLVKNIGRYIQEHPEDARGHYTLGRVHSLAFSMGAAEVQVSGDGAQDLPGFPPYQSIQVPARAPGKLSPALAAHLEASLREYLRATELAPKNALYWLGLGWMLEQGAPFADQVRSPFPDRLVEKENPREDWFQKALTAYRRAYRLELDSDLKKPSFGPAQEYSISLEAGEGILRILDKRGPNPAEQKEAAEVRASVKALQGKPRAVTPILFPIDGRGSLASLLSPGHAVRFDLAADGRSERWPWVNASAGILVWDPGHTGRITSGQQLFGSRTWQMFWPDGYAPLAALDDDRDGWLAGPEIEGLAVWRDRNSDGKSQPGEVLPVAAYGIARVAVRSTGTGEGVPANSSGIELTSGARVPTYDWTP